MLGYDDNYFVFFYLEYPKYKPLVVAPTTDVGKLNLTYLNSNSK